MKNQKKQAKRELILVQAAKHDSDTNLVKKILDLQQLLDGISDEVKADFLEGTNGAVVCRKGDGREKYKLLNNYNGIQSLYRTVY